MIGGLDLNVDDLRLLLALARTGRMGTAGASLGLDHTTVSRRIKRLEKSLNASLITRGSDGWELTVLGQKVAESASPIDGVVERVRDAASGADASLRGTVRVAAPDGFGVSFVAPAIAAVLREHPGISTELVTSTRPLSSRGAGFDMTVSIGVPQTGRLATELLTPYSLALYASQDYLDSHHPIRGLDDLSGHLLIFYVDALLSVAELDLTRNFAGLRVGFASTNVLAQVAVTRASAGIGLLPCFLAEGYSDLIRVLPTDVRFELNFSLSVRPQSRDSEAVMVIREALLKEIASRESELVPGS
jgi:DNA-binding transcriptional LysR family regulator